MALESLIDINANDVGLKAGAELDAQRLREICLALIEALDPNQVLAFIINYFGEEAIPERIQEVILVGSVDLMLQVAANQLQRDEVTYVSFVEGEPAKGVETLEFSENGLSLYVNYDDGEISSIDLMMGEAGGINEVYHDIPKQLLSDALQQALRTYCAKVTSGTNNE